MLERMPTYCYRTEEGYDFERDYPMGEAPEVIHFKGWGVATRDYQAEGVSGSVIGTENPVERSKSKRPWPMTCCASGVHASQAGELRKHLADRGCVTEVTPSGDPVYTSASHRRKALKIRGFFDKASYC